MKRRSKENAAREIYEIITKDTDPDDALEVLPDYFHYRTDQTYTNILGADAGLVPALEASLDGEIFYTAISLANYLSQKQEDRPTDADFAMTGKVMANAMRVRSDMYEDLALAYPRKARRLASRELRRAKRLEILARRLDPDARIHFDEFVEKYKSVFQPGSGDFNDE